MNEEAILRAINELDSWEERKQKLQEHMKTMSRQERKFCNQELGRINEQIYHYRKLLKEMKSEVSPARTGDFLEHLK